MAETQAQIGLFADIFVYEVGTSIEKQFREKIDTNITKKRLKNRSINSFTESLRYQVVHPHNLTAGTTLATSVIFGEPDGQTNKRTDQRTKPLE